MVAMWESKAQADRWVAEQLFPAFQAAGIAADMANAEFTGYETGELYMR